MTIPYRIVRSACSASVCVGGGGGIRKIGVTHAYTIKPLGPSTGCVFIIYRYFEVQGALHTGM